MNSILILGGYGNFGRRIATALAKASLPVIIAGRNMRKAEQQIEDIRRVYPDAALEAVAFDVNRELSSRLARLKPGVVVNTCGPFQLCDYAVAETCVRHQVHYIDLADAREFVTGMTRLDVQARQAGVLVVSGASTVPGLSSAVLDAYRHEFAQIDGLKYGISPGQKATRGLATTRAIMTYVGRPFKPFNGAKQVYGWQDIYRQKYPELGYRWMANCEVPDLDLLPERYGIKSIRFSAGMELTFLHLGIWGMSWLVRLGLPLKLPAASSFLLKASNWFDRFGTANGGMHMIIQGRDEQDRFKEVRWFIIARHGDGPQIPTIPASVLARKLVSGEITLTGAVPCVGLVTLDEYKNELDGFDMQYYCERSFDLS